MKRIKRFIIELIIKVIDNDLISMANALTFKLLLGSFPFIIFLMTLIAFFNLRTDTFINGLSQDMPTEIMSIINVVIDEVVNTKRISLLSSSLMISLYSASSGFYYVMKGFNQAYGIDDSRGIVRTRAISFALVLIFCGIIIGSLYLVIFSDLINKLIVENTFLEAIPAEINSLRGYTINAMVLLGMIIIMYKLALAKKTCIKELLPGALFTILSWLVLSKGFNIYVNNFSKYSMVYGSIGGVFVFAIWLNLLAYVLLIGGQINAIIYERKRGKRNG